MAKKVHKLVWDYSTLLGQEEWLSKCCGMCWDKGTTEDSGVTCKRCLASIKKGKK